MPQNDEEKFNAGLSVLEMTRTAGWQWLERKIRQELTIEEKELRGFDLTDLQVEQIAAQYLQHRANLAAYENVLAMAETAISEKDAAAIAMKGQ